MPAVERLAESSAKSAIIAGVQTAPQLADTANALVDKFGEEKAAPLVTDLARLLARPGARTPADLEAENTLLGQIAVSLTPAEQIFADGYTPSAAERSSVPAMLIELSHQIAAAVRSAGTVRDASANIDNGMVRYPVYGKISKGTLVKCGAGARGSVAADAR